MGEREQLDWEIVRSDFEFDGSWRDIYVLGTNTNDWQRLLDALTSWQYRVSYRNCDGEEEAEKIPTDAQLLFSKEIRGLLCIGVGDVEVNCHFFVSTEIEFDIDPRQIKGQSELGNLIEFMKRVASVTDKQAVLTSENSSENVIIRVLPNSGGVNWIAPTS